MLKVWNITTFDDEISQIWNKILRKGISRDPSKYSYSYTIDFSVESKVSMDIFDIPTKNVLYHQIPIIRHTLLMSQTSVI